MLIRKDYWRQSPPVCCVAPGADRTTGTLGRDYNASQAWSHRILKSVRFIPQITIT
jgi:hypothetical protein